MNEIETIAAKFGLSLPELSALLNETDAARNLATPAEVGGAIEEIAKIYITALASAASRFEDPVERRIADRIVSLTVELLGAQLASAPNVRN